MVEKCDNLAGWNGINHKWAHCRGGEEACLTIELLQVTSGYAYVGVDRSWAAKQGMFIDKGSYIEYYEDDTRWRVYCDDVNTSQNLASIRICYDEPEHEPEPEPVTDGYDISLYGSTTVFGITFTNTKLLCATSQAIVRPTGLAAKTIAVGGAAAMWSVGSIILPGRIITSSVIMGRVYASLKTIDEACTTATVDIFNDVYTKDDHDDTVNDINDVVGDEGDGTFTKDEIDEAVTQAERNVADSPEEKQRQEDVANGVMTPEEAQEERNKQIADETMRILFEDNFTLSIPGVVMAGEVEVSGSAPIQNTDIQIVAVRKYLGFDWLRADKVLAEVTSDDNYEYEATIELDEFGSVDVYARIPKEWWEILDEDITSEKHSVWVLTWTIIIGMALAAGLIIEKKYNMLGLFKGGKK